MNAFVTRHPVRKDEAAESLPTEQDARPSKRLKRKEISDSESDGISQFQYENSRLKKLHQKVEEDSDEQRHGRPTDFENALPAAQLDEDTIKEYEAFKSSQTESKEDAADGAGGKTRSMWIRGRSSIYVDAFNLALDTVLDEESHLFDEKEKDIFRQWKELDYEAQYLYVRLFLRKAATWHRSSKFSYHSDISDMDAAMQRLQETRSLPVKAEAEVLEGAHGLDEEEYHLGDTFTFADASEDYITTVEEAAPLLLLDEVKGLAKEAKVQGRNKADLIKALIKMTEQQSGLMSLGLSRHNSRESNVSGESTDRKPVDKIRLRRENSNRKQHFLDKMLAILGPCVRLSPPTFKLFERVHLVFYRSTEWTEKSLTTIILAKIARRNFPEYIVCRTSNIFDSRADLLEFETGIRMEADVDRVLEFNGPPGEEGYQRIMDIYDRVYPRWKVLIVREQEKEHKVYDMSEGAYLRRFTPGHSYTRIVHKALYVLGRRKEHAREHGVLQELLDQKLFHMARRGAWYQRKALLEEHYMAELDEERSDLSLEQRKRHWKSVAISTCEEGLQDPDCHLIFHYDLQKRLMKLEKKAKVAQRHRHDFGHVRLADPLEVTVQGIQLKRDHIVKPGRQAASTKTVWLDELDTGTECSVEEMCLSQFRQDGWKGYHSEGGIMRTLFAYLFYDILFIYIPNVFQTAYQTCPLDLHTDAFYPVRASEINHRLVAIANGGGPRLVHEVWEREHERRTSVVGLNWDFDVDDLTELVSCFDGAALSAVCKVMAQEYRQRGGGMPDLILWRPTVEQTEGDGPSDGDDASNAKDKNAGAVLSNSEMGPGSARGEVMFVEVKSANDRLSDTQRLWIHVLTGAGVKVALCNAVAKEVREVT